MAKNPKPPTVAQSTDIEAEEVASYTLSARFTDQQKDLVEQAANVKNWTTANFIRTAALEKAAHILNTTTRTRFDIKSIAYKVARQLTKPEIWLENWDDGSRLDPGSRDYPDTLRPVAEKFVLKEIEQLKRASKLGGTEFLQLVINALEDLTMDEREDLPEPIEIE